MVNFSNQKSVGELLALRERIVKQMTKEQLLKELKNIEHRLDRAISRQKREINEGKWMGI